MEFHRGVINFFLVGVLYDLIYMTKRRLPPPPFAIYRKRTRESCVRGDGMGMVRVRGCRVARKRNLQSISSGHLRDTVLTEDVALVL